MSVTVCIAASTLYYPEGGGHMWVYLNWALGFMSNGCKVIWMEEIKPSAGRKKNLQLISILQRKLQDYGLQDNIALWQSGGTGLDENYSEIGIDVETAAVQSDILLNQDYVMPFLIIRHFRKSVLLDIDPGLLQMWITKDALHIAPHNFYFTTGETVGVPGSRIPSCGLKWIYTPPCVSLEHWPKAGFSNKAAFTTVTHWSGNGYEEYNGQPYPNDKRDGFLPFISLPKYTSVPLELAILLSNDEIVEEQTLLQQNGWSVKDSHKVAGTPAAYQQYIKNSAGEFSCVKPSCLFLQNAWISDRTLCYLASGKPAVVQNTGASNFLPDADGLLRFKNFTEALKLLEKVAVDYDKQSERAHALAKEYFDAKKITRNLLEKVL